MSHSSALAAKLPDFGLSSDKIGPRELRHDSQWKSDLWSWKHWMTIGIGVLASESRKETDHIILCNDWLGSFGDRFSTPLLYKVFSCPSAKVFVVGAGDLTKAGKLVTKIAKSVEVSGEGAYSKTDDAIFSAVHEYKSARFRYEVVAQPVGRVNRRISASAWLGSGARQSW